MNILNDKQSRRRFLHNVSRASGGGIMLSTLTSGFLVSDFSNSLKTLTDKLDVNAEKEMVRPRVVILSDFPPVDVIPGGAGHGSSEKRSDTDDLQSFIRLLLYTNELDLEGLVASSATVANVANKQGILDMLNLYAWVQDNLRRHDKRYPTARYLQSVTWQGYSGSYAQPANEILGVGKESEASNAIIDLVDRDDPRPIWFCVWGGSQELAQAVFTVSRTRSTEETEKFIDKLRVYLIALQDGSGQWLLDNFPNMFIIHSANNWRGMQFNAPGSDAALADISWLNKHVRRGKGILGLIYPESDWFPDHQGVGEGDSPSFLHLVSGVRKINDSEQPNQPGWGGCFVRLNPTKNHWTDDPAGQETVWRWRSQVQKEFAERMSWCVD